MWNYRVIRRKMISIDPTNNKEKADYVYAIHEAYYDKNGHVGAITNDPAEPFGENIEELRHSWVMMAEAFGQPILDYDNIPEPEYDRKDDPIGSVLDERLRELENGTADMIPWEQVKKDLEEKRGPFDEEDFRKSLEDERIEKERIHENTFVGTPSAEELTSKICSDYRDCIQRDRAESSSIEEEEV